MQVQELLAEIRQIGRRLISKHKMAYIDVAREATPARMLAAFPDLEPLDSRPSSSESKSSVDSEKQDIFDGHNKEQIRLMNEACIAVDYDDTPYAAGSKKTLHLMSSIDKGLLHRAFSVFLFNDEGKLLLQQRASEKITFPDLWTNTCCSHPLAITSELGSSPTLDAYIAGAKNAAVRKLDHELGIKPADVPVANFRFITRIHYMAPSNGPWGEHEIDYILFVKANPVFTPEPNEVRDTKWVTKDELQRMFADPQYLFTPWFKLICESFLFGWWDNPEGVVSERQIQRML